MGERSGVGLVEFSILDALDSRGARSRRRPAENTRVLADVERSIGLAPGYAYEVLLDLARPWRLPVLLLEGFGNYGDLRGGPAAAFRHTASRLSPAGEVAVAAENRELGPVPIELINGNTHREGRRPPFRPAGIIGAIRQVIRRPRVSGNDLSDMVGPPDFLTGCTVTGDFAALAGGHPAVLQLQARVTVADDRRSVVIQNMPPNDNRDQIIAELGNEASGRPRHRHLSGAGNLPIADVRDISLDGDDRFICVPKPGTTPEVLCHQLLAVEGITTTMPVALPGSLPTMMRRWVRSYQDEDLLTSLAGLEDAVRSQPAWNWAKRAI
jgi:hypothetical protein